MIALPEVIRLELARNLARRLNEWVSSINDDHRQLLAVFGSLKEVVLPSPQEIAERASNILSSVGVPIRDIPFTLEAARSSLLKVIDALPPSGKKDQQFKDGVIWADCLGLLAESDVYLVTCDKAFYEDRKYNLGLAKSLAEEAAGRTYKIRIFNNLTQILEDISSTISVDRVALVKEVLLYNADARQSMLGSAGFHIKATTKVDVRLFATENVRSPFLTYDLIFSCSNGSEESWKEATLALSGDGMYDTSSSTFSSIKIAVERLTYSDDDGNEVTTGFSYASAEGTMGHKTVRHTIRAPLVGAA